MKCERSVIIMILLRLGYLVHSLGNCAMTLHTETSISPLFCAYLRMQCAACLADEISASIKYLDVVTL